MYYILIFFQRIEVSDGYFILRNFKTAITLQDLALIHFVLRLFFYKQLALEWQITKQHSGLNPLSLSNTKKLQIKEK